MQPTITAKDGTQLDGTVVNLARAIRKVESGGSFTAKGASGENGGYQFMPETWKGWAGKHLKDPNAEMSPINQDKVAYYQIKEWKDQGYSPAQIASMWNAGEGRPNAFKENWKGTVTLADGRKVDYDTPTYVNKVINEFRTVKATSPVKTATEPSPQQVLTPVNPTFFGNLSQDFAQRGANMAEASARQASGMQGFGSTVLQDVGQVAGGIGDVLMEALSAADRVVTGGKVGEVLGGAVSGVAQTAPVQKAMQAYGDFKSENPVTAANIEAVANIASVVPVGTVGSTAAKASARGAAQLGTKIAETEAAQSLAMSAVKKAETNLKDIFENSSKSTVRDAYEFMTGRGYDPERILSERKLITQIDIQDGRVRIPEDSSIFKTLSSEVATDSRRLDKAISLYPRTLTADDIKAEINDAIARNVQFRQQGRVPELQERASKIVDDYSVQEGKKRFKLIDVQNMKKGQYALSSKYRKALDEGKADEHSAVASALMQIVEDNVTDVSVRKLNRKIGELESTIQLLEKLDGATIRGGRAGRYMARVLGATVGSQGAVPIISPVVGALVGDAIITALQKIKIAGPINRLLIKIARVSPDNKLVQDTLDFVEAVESGNKVLPSDEVLEFLAQLSIKADIPLLPEPLEREFRSVVGSGAPINLPARSQSTIDAQEIARASQMQGRGQSAMVGATKDGQQSTPQSAQTQSAFLSQPSPESTIKGAVSSPGTKSSRPSTVTNTSTSNALTERGGVSAQKTDTSGGFGGAKDYKHVAEMYSSPEEFYNRMPQEVRDGLRAQNIKGQEQITAYWEKATNKTAQNGYQMSHRPSEGPRAFDLTESVDGDQMVPKDMYQQWYGSRGTKADKESIEALKAIKGNPDADVTIYRASPTGDFNEGDWVTFSKSYAEEHAAGNGSKVASKVVKAKDVRWAADDINEFGYYPEKPSPSTPKSLSPLYEEAKKYKTAEEFVNNKINVFHATNEAQAKSIESVGFKPSLGRGFSNQPGNFAFFTPSVDGAIRYSKTSGNGLNKITSGHLKGNILKIDGMKADFEAFGEASRKLGVPLGKDSQGNLSMLDIEGLKNALRENGYSAIEFKDKYSNGARAIAAIPEDVKTKSQLLDIWKKANNK